MNQLKLIVILFLLAQPFLSIGQTQFEMNNASANRLKKAETELIRVLAQIKDLYKSDAEFLKNLKESQDIWIKFKTAELKMKFPDRDPGYYGSVHSMCVADYLTDLTLARVETLRVWVTGIEQEDVCSGSVRMKD